MKRSKLFRDISRNNTAIEKENREKLRAMYEKYRKTVEDESEVVKNAETEKK